MSAIPLFRLPSSGRWQQDFLCVMSAVQNHAAVCFRRLRPESRTEAIAEAVAQAFVSYGHLARQNKLARVYRGSLAHFAVRGVLRFRPVGGHQNSRDVMSPLTQKCRRAVVTSLTPWCRETDGWREVAVEAKRVSPADTACFRLDFQEWLKEWPDRHRRIIAALASEERTLDVAERFGLTQGRISQLRRQYERSWLVFQGMA